MLEYIKGNLIRSSPNIVIVETNGLGYRIFIPTRLYPQLPPVGENVQLYTSFIVRETAFSLYGFLSCQERELFEVLISISGVGPKTAIALISSLDYQQLLDAVNTHNVTVISKAPGIGKKTAERLIIEIRDKLPGLASVPHGSSLHSRIQSLQIPAETIRDAMSALINLGYNHANAEKAISYVIKQSNEGMDLPTLISKALKTVNS